MGKREQKPQKQTFYELPTTANTRAYWKTSNHRFDRKQNTKNNFYTANYRDINVTKYFIILIQAFLQHLPTRGTTISPCVAKTAGCHETQPASFFFPAPHWRKGSIPSTSVKGSLHPYNRPRNMANVVPYRHNFI